MNVRFMFRLNKIIVLVIDDDRDSFYIEIVLLRLVISSFKAFSRCHILFKGKGTILVGCRDFIIVFKDMDY